MATSDSMNQKATPIQPLIGSALTFSAAAEMMLTASRNMLAASGEASGGEARRRDLLAEAVESGLLRALRRQSLLGEEAGQGFAGGLSLPGAYSGGIRGTGYGRLGASVTGEGARARTYGSIGGAIGYAVGGPVGALIGGMLGGLFGGDDDEEERRRQEEELRRQWLNTPEGFEIQAYLYNLARVDLTLASLLGARWGAAQTVPLWGSQLPTWQSASQVVVRMEQGAVQVQAPSAEVGQQAARAFAGELGRTLRLNSVVVPAAGFGGEA